MQGGGRQLRLWLNDAQVKHDDPKADSSSQIKSVPNYQDEGCELKPAGDGGCIVRRMTAFQRVDKVKLLRSPDAPQDASTFADSKVDEVAKRSSCMSPAACENLSCQTQRNRPKITEKM